MQGDYYTKRRSLERIPSKRTGIFPGAGGCDRREHQLFCFPFLPYRSDRAEAKGMGVWAAKRIQVRMEGEDADVEAIYHRYFIQFLSTGG